MCRERRRRKRRRRRCGRRGGGGGGGRARKSSGGGSGGGGSSSGTYIPVAAAAGGPLPSCRNSCAFLQLLIYNKRLMKLENSTVCFTQLLRLQPPHPKHSCHRYWLCTTFELVLEVALITILPPTTGTTGPKRGVRRRVSPWTACRTELWCTHSAHGGVHNNSYSDFW